MADENQFKVVLGADSSQLKAALNDAFKSVQDFAIRVSKLPQIAFSTQGIDNYKKSVAQLKSEVNQLSLQNLNRELININSTVAKANLEGVRIRIDADTSQLQKSLTFAATEINKLRDERITISADIKPLEASLLAATKEVQDFAISVRKIPQVAFSTGGIDNYKKSVAQLKSEVANLNLDGFARDLVTVNTAAARANLDTIKITVEGNTLPLQKALTAATGLVDQFGVSAIRTSNQTESSFQSIAASAVSLQTSLKNIPNAFDAIESGSTNLSNVKTALDSAAGNAIKASGTFERFGQQASAAFSEAGAAAAKSAAGYELVGKSINDLHSDLARLTRELQTATNPADVDRLKNSILQINTALSNVKAQGRLDIIDPKTTVELNSASTALSNMGRTAGAALSGINESLDTASGKALQAANTFEGFGQRIVSAISQFSATRGSLNQITAAINEAELAAQQAGKSFLNIGVSVPNKQIDSLRNNVATLKAELASGFRPIINVVDPKTPALLNSVSAALVNIGPATDVVSAALVRTQSNLNTFAVTVNKSLSDSVRSFDVFKTQATQLGVAFDKIPAAVQPIDTTSITAFKEAVESLKRDIAGLQFKGALQDVRPPLNSINVLRVAVDQLKKDMSVGTNVPININAAPTLKTLADLQAELKGFQTALLTATDPKAVDRLNKAIAQTNAQIKNLKGIGVTSFTGLQKGAAASAVSVSNVGKSLGGVKPGANAAGLALTDFSRIIQDVPFGVIGITNNINPMIESFARAKAATGSTGAAFKAMAGSLMGPAGIGLAIAAVSSAFIIFQNGISGFNRKTKEAKEATDAYGDSLRSNITSLAGEASRISILVNALKADNATRLEKKAIIEELQSLNPSYFASLKQEEGIIKGLDAAYQSYLASIKKKFEVKVLENQLEKLFDRKFNIETSFDEKQNLLKFKEIADARLALETQIQRKIDVLGGDRLTKDLKSEDIYAGRVTDNQKEILRLQNQLSEVRGRGVKAFDLQGTAKEDLRFIDLQIEGLLEKIGKMGAAGLGLKKPKEAKETDEVLQSLNAQLDLYKARVEDSNKLREAGLITMAQERQALLDQVKVFELLLDIDAREVAIGLKPRLEVDVDLIRTQIAHLREDYAARMRAAIQKPIEFTPQFKIGNLDFFEKLSEAVRKQTEAKEIGVNIPLNISITGESNVTAVFDKIKQDINKVSLEDAFKPMVDRMVANAHEAKESIETGIVATFSELDVEDAITGAISNIGESLGRALATGINPFVAVAESFLQALGSVVQAFGQRIVALAIAMKITKEAITKAFSNPAVAIAAGAALVILGGVLKNIKFNVPGAAQGGLLSGPQSGYLALLHGQEVVSPIGKYNEMMGGQSVIAGDWIIKGTDLVFIQREVLKKRGRM